MDRINHASAESDKFGAGKDGWTNGDPADESSGTVPQEEWFDGVQEELVGIIEAAGLTPSDGDYTQVAEALEKLFLARTGITDDGDDLTKLYTATRANGHILNVFVSDSDTFVVAWNADWLQGTGWTSVGAGSPSAITLDGVYTNPRIVVEYPSIAGGVFTTRRVVGPPPIAARVQLSAGSIDVTGHGFGDSDVTLNATDLTISFDTAFPDTNYIVSLTGEFDSAHYVYDFDRINASSMTVYALNSNFAQQTMSTFVGTFHIVVEPGPL